MKRIITIVTLAFAMSGSIVAQNTDGVWTLNTRAWSTNYFTSAIYGIVREGAISLIMNGNTEDSLHVERIIPDADLVFPIGMGKKGFGDDKIYGPYHRAFGNPFKHIGDYAVGLDASWHPSLLGLYAGAYFKSQEIVSKNYGSLRGYYIQPRVGVMVGNKERTFDAGVFYDVLTGSGGSAADTNKDRLKGGWGLDFTFSTTDKKRRSAGIIQISVPLHNFLNTDYAGQQGMKRKVGYIMFSERIYL